MASHGYETLQKCPDQFLKSLREFSQSKHLGSKQTWSFKNLVDIFRNFRNQIQN